MIPDLPGWDSLPAVARYHSWAELIGIVLLGLLVVAEVVTFKYGYRKDDLTEQQQNATDQRHDEEMARLQLETAQANEKLQAEHLERLKLEAIIVGRQLTVEQIASIANTLKRFAGREVYLSSYTGDAEAARFSLQIKMALEESGIHIEDLIGMTVVGQGIAGGGGLRFGIHIEGINSDDDLISAVVDGLEKHGNVKVETITRPGMIRAGRATLGIMIGLRPL